jgi:hypothetical protein
MASPLRFILLGRSTHISTANAEHPKKDQSFPNVVEKNIGKSEETRGSAGFGSGGKSHATGDSVVPEAVQRVAPEKLEKALPEAVHPTKGSEIDPDPQQNKTAKK